MEVTARRPGSRGMKGSLNGGLSGMRNFFSHPGFALERGSLWTGLYTFILLGVAELFLFNGFLRGIAGFESRFGPFLGFLVFSLALNSSAVWYVSSIRGKVTCMTGCMSGMTLGMIGGFTLGAVVGATNGMLVGSVYGLAAGIALGSLAGRCCGVMGTMEGMMAGFMGGVMGAMTSLMMISENVFIFLGILMAVSAFILAGLMKVFRKETAGDESNPIRPPNIYTLLAINLLVLLATTWLFAFGPRSVLVASITTWGV